MVTEGSRGFSLWVRVRLDLEIIKHPPCRARKFVVFYYVYVVFNYSNNNLTPVESLLLMHPNRRVLLAIR